MKQVIIPWRYSGCEIRLRHFTNLYNFYSKYFDVIVADNIGRFNRSAARNSGVERCNQDIVVVLDADNLISPKQIHDAIDLAEDGVLAKPFEWFGYLDEESTKKFYGGVREISSLSFESDPRKSFKGGAYVMKRSLWVEIEGMDEGFIGWGGEDDAFHIKCRTNNIPVKYVDGFCYHLFHPATRILDRKNALKIKKEYYRV